MKIFAESDRFILREILLTDVEGLYELDSDPTAVIALDYAFKELKAEEVFAAASCENFASNRTLQKLGLHFIEIFFSRISSLIGTKSTRRSMMLVGIPTVLCYGNSAERLKDSNSHFNF